jgi:ABC-2 type transport system permease protein
MSTQSRAAGRLSTLAAALVIARRDFTAILFSRSFLFFLLGPLFPVVVGALAGSVGNHAQSVAARPVVGVAMAGTAGNRVIEARRQLAPNLGDDLPEFTLVRAEPPARPDEARQLLREQHDLAALLSGTLAQPVLTGPPDHLDEWRGRLALILGHARELRPQALPDLRLDRVVAQSRVDLRHGQVMTAQAAQTLLFLLTMLLAGMVLSNLVEEKGNKIIETLAAAIPMDAVFLGKLFAMLAVSLVGIAVWFAAGTVIHLVAGSALPTLDPPAIGWPLFYVLGIVYFSLGYLVLGSLFLSIGSMAATVRDVQTMSMPVTMLQLIVFFFASYAMTDTGSAIELLAVAIPFSSPFAMLARAAVSPLLWPHALAIAWQVLCVSVFVKLGAGLFRRRVMKSGSAGGQSRRRGLWSRLRAAS